MKLDEDRIPGCKIKATYVTTPKPELRLDVKIVSMWRLLWYAVLEELEIAWYWWPFVVLRIFQLTLLYRIGRWQAFTFKRN